MADYGSIEWAKLPEETARKKLQKLRGVGPWTVDMVMIFAIGELSVLISLFFEVFYSSFLTTSTRFLTIALSSATFKSNQFF